MYDVTLWHIYQALGRNLREWQEWDEFLDGFHRRILQVTNVDREGLRRDSNLLRNLWGELRRIRRERLFTHTTAGERDVVESASVVRKRQEQIARRLRARNEGARRREEKFEELFPELKRLRPLHDPD